jgi:hypothetical protein
MPVVEVQAGVPVQLLRRGAAGEEAPPPQPDSDRNGHEPDQKQAGQDRVGEDRGVGVFQTPDDVSDDEYDDEDRRDRGENAAEDRDQIVGVVEKTPHLARSGSVIPCHFDLLKSVSRSLGNERAVINPSASAGSVGLAQPNRPHYS